MNKIKIVKYLTYTFVFAMFLSNTSFEINKNIDTVTDAKGNSKYKKFIKRVLAMSNSLVEFEMIESYNTDNCRVDCTNGITLKYNPDFLEDTQKGFGFSESKIIDWVAQGVLVHEAGHIALAHCKSYRSGSKQAEIEADIYMGKTLHNLNATLTQAQSCLYLPSVTLEGSNVYPTRAERLENVKKGWDSVSDNNDGIVGLREARRLYISGGQKNYKKAFPLFFKNSNKDFFSSTDNYMIGMMYVYKLGVKRDVNLGKAHLYFAYFSGNKKAEEELLYLEN